MRLTKKLYPSCPSKFVRFCHFNYFLKRECSAVEESYFDGSMWQLIAWSILAWLLTFISFGFAYPWAICMLQRWEAEHTVVDSHRLVFDGKGGQLFGLWFVLSIIPLGILILAIGISRKFIEVEFTGGLVLVLILLIAVALCYVYFVRIQLKKWFVRHTHFQCKPAYAYPPRDTTDSSTPAPAYAPERTARVSQPTEPDLLDKLIPVGSIREMVFPAILGVLTLAGTIFLLAFLFA